MVYNREIHRLVLPAGVPRQIGKFTMLIWIILAWIVSIVIVLSALMRPTKPLTGIENLKNRRIFGGLVIGLAPGTIAVVLCWVVTEMLWEESTKLVGWVARKTGMDK